MKDETPKKGSIERYRDSSPVTVFIILVITIVLVYFSITTGVNLAFDGFDKIYSGYPDEQYKELEKELDNVVVNNKYIDIKNISDPNIDFTEIYTRSNSKFNLSPQENWNITLKKGDIEVYSTINKSSDGTLEVKTIRDTSKAGFYVNQTVATAIVVIISLIVATSIWAIIVVIYFWVIDRLVDIEKNVSKKS